MRRLCSCQVPVQLVLIRPLSTRLTAKPHLISESIILLFLRSPRHRQIAAAPSIAANRGHTIISSDVASAPPSPGLVISLPVSHFGFVYAWCFVRGHLLHYQCGAVGFRLPAAAGVPKAPSHVFPAEKLTSPPLFHLSRHGNHRGGSFTGIYAGRPRIRLIRHRTSIKRQEGSDALAFTSCSVFCLGWRTCS